ncbi:MAG: hypothetical protein IPO87_19210 [Flavobacteriales bacterium]|nr:hypothetical protein [Flavobacteriales bacterium]
MDRRFTTWDHTSIPTAEGYYKLMNQSIPMELDNVHPLLRRQFGEGFCHRIDLKLNGEFIDGVESWIGISNDDDQRDLFNDTYTKRYNANGLSDRSRLHLRPSGGGQYSGKTLAT